MAFQPTQAQANAINATGHILVSAAAGSGKTAVLVERVIQKLADAASPVNIDQLLIVTFTNSAAAEMRSRIERRLAQELEIQKENRHLLRQQMLLSCAKICTIDSFCIDFARQNFYELDIDPGFKVFDPKAADALLQKTAASVLLRQYSSVEDPDFDAVLTTFGSAYGEKQVQDLMLRIYNFTRSLPAPTEWITAAKLAYAQANISVWTCDFFDKSLSWLQNLSSQLIDVRSALAPYTALHAKYDTYFATVQQTVTDLITVCQSQDWDKTVALLKDFTVTTDLRGKFPDEVIKSEIANARSAVTSTFSRMREMFGADLAQEKELIQKLAPTVNKLLDLVLLLQEEFLAEMKKRSQFTFAEIEHMVLRLLKNEPSVFHNQFTEVLVDEYQDVNDLQNALFYALSDNGKNLFMVGDAKQSIYGFRNANPSNFINCKDNLPVYQPGQPASKIILSNNFRSREGICLYINHLFSLIMSKETAQIDYNEEERLVPTAKYLPIDDCDVQLHMLDLSESEEDNTRVEARYLAGYIRRTLSAPAFLKDGGDSSDLRRAQPKDFAILLRTVENKSSIFLEEFKKAGVPITVEVGNLFATAEIMLVVSVLKVIDNPAKDIPLLAAMLSPVFAFTPDRVAQLRGKYKNTTLIGTVSLAAQEGEADCVVLLKQLDNLRSLAVTLPPCKLLAAVYKKFSLIEIVSAMDDGERRRANLLLLISYAEQFVDNDEGGLSAFIRYLDTMEEGGKIKSAGASAENAVKIMSIHGSKGLQFPITILACCSKPFNKQDITEKIILDDTLYLGVKYLDRVLGIQYSTVARRAIVDKQLAKNIAEEMRLLYVAMTRAEEKLVLLVSENNLSGKIDSALESGFKTEKSVNSYSDWILSAAVQHPGTKRGLLGLPQDLLQQNGQAQVIFGRVENDINMMSDSVDEESACINKAFLQMLQDRFSFVYPYKKLQGVLAKTAVTQLVDKIDPTSHAFLKRPAFLSKKGLTPAERGTATHKYLQYADFFAAKQSPESELERLVEYEYITEKEGQAIDLKAICGFFDSDIFARIVAADRYEKEKSFIVEVPLTDIPGENTLVQGIADCVFYQNGEAVILDFKTDRITAPEELVERYRAQLQFYAKAIAQIEGLPVRECILYSLHLNRPISFFVEDDKNE